MKHTIPADEHAQQHSIAPGIPADGRGGQMNTAGIERSPNMNTLTRWNLLREMEELQNRLSTLLGRAPVRRRNGEQESITVAEWAPLVDITEDDKEYLINAELPEVKKENGRSVFEQDISSLCELKLMISTRSDRVAQGRWEIFSRFPTNLDWARYGRKFSKSAFFSGLKQPAGQHPSVARNFHGAK